MNEPLYPDSILTGKIIGCAIEVHTHLGNGFQEVIYQRALAIEFRRQAVGYTHEPEIEIYYKQDLIGSRQVDFMVEDKIVVEIKALLVLEPVHLAQALNYLEAFNIKVGLLLNFGARRLEFHRLHNRKLQ